MRTVRQIQLISQEFLDIIIPPVCLSCKDVVQEQGQICAECWQNIPLISKHKCNKCGLPFEFDMGKGAKCQQCSSSKPKFKKVLAVCKHEGTARKLAVNLKFNDRTHLAPYIASMMVSMGRELLEKTDIIIPVPLHSRRRLFRKYNQSALLGQQIAKQSGVDYSPFVMKRVRSTTPQTRLSKKDREKNVKDAFSVTNKLAVEGKRILLIDDVMTTGATINECTAALKEAGVKHVNGLVFSRVVPDRV